MLQNTITLFETDSNYLKDKNYRSAFFIDYRL